MENSFSYIRNRISEYKKDDIIEYCYLTLEKFRNQPFPVWYIFTLLKWTYKYGGKRYPPKELTEARFAKLYNSISNVNPEHATAFLKRNETDKFFVILHNQQFYLQVSVSDEIFATQQKIFSTLKGKYNIDESFKIKAGISILDFLKIQKIIWLYTITRTLETTALKFTGFFDPAFQQIAASFTSTEAVNSYIKLLTLDPENIEESMNRFSYKLKNENFQTMEMSFFTMFPFQIYKNRIRLIHESIFRNSANYYLYHFMKQNDDKFTTELGYRLEKFIALGLKEMELVFRTENELKQLLPKDSSLVDFYAEQDNIFIECKASELQSYPSVNPTDELIFNSLKSSIIKAYFEQLLPVSLHLAPNKENWGIIITYKEMFWSQFCPLFEIAKAKYPNITTFAHLPPENVFIIDVFSWNLVVQIVKDKKAPLIEILRQAKRNNDSPETKKMLFKMHLDRYDLGKMHLSYLEDELRLFDLKSDG